MKNYSKRELYAAGEPLGDSATRTKPGGRVYGGGGGGGSSSAQTTNYIDKRNAVQDGLGISGDGNAVSINMTSTDGGIVTRALDTVDLSILSSNDSFTKSLEASRAANEAAIASAQRSAASAIASANANTAASLSFADGQIGRALTTVDATLGQGFGRLMDISENLFKSGGKLIDQTQATVAGAYADAQNTAKGTIDNRTMIILGVAAAATLVMIRRK